MTDALIAVERMNGINLYGFKLSVALAKYKGKSKVRVHEVQNENHVERNTGVATENVTISNRKLEKAKISWHQDLEQERENSENSNVEVKLSKGGNGGNQPSESLSESSSEEVEKSSTFLDKGNDGVSNETVNAECFFNNCCEDNHVDVIWAHADVLFQKVGPFCENNDNLGQQGFGVKAESSWVEVISKKPAETNDKGVPLGSLPDPVGVAEKVPTKVVEDVSNLGILPLGDDVSQIKDLWVDEVDVFITSFSDPCPSRAQGDKDEPGNFFLELKTIRKSRKEKNSESEVGKRAMRILLWNVRGIGASVKVLAISKLIREQMMEMVLL
ncbi:hypothetical protein V6N11_037391 [Hibiscus sabdariffa]|uniref:Uncharacterized protein n=1 Tax=Hibiscus sabdariffa TaxID=183260 RepID=A0ABR2P1R1_9ROSI